MWSSGAIRPIVGAELPLGQAADAHRLIEERRHAGKVVLLP
jgi:NADPH:quinone reductase-like Zn-dependent oxidoreductase